MEPFKPMDVQTKSPPPSGGLFSSDIYSPVLKGVLFLFGLSMVGSFIGGRRLFGQVSGLFQSLTALWALAALLTVLIALVLIVRGIVALVRGEGSREISRAFVFIVACVVVGVGTCLMNLFVMS